MNQKKFAAVLVGLLGFVGVVLAETDYIAMPIIQDIQKGENNGNQIKTLQVSGPASVGTYIKSYGYDVNVSSNKSGLVYMTQPFSAPSYIGSTPTNTFVVPFIATPSVVVTYTASTTNAVQLYATISTNQVIVTAATNYSGIAYGRVK